LKAEESWGGANRTVFALDSFEGFPEPSLQDKSPRNPKKGEWSESPNKQFNYSVSNLLRILECAELSHYLKFEPPEAIFANAEKLRVIKGFFDKTTQTLELSQIALLHLDGDLYESVRAPLNNLANKIAVGGVVVIDDYKLEKETNTEEAFPGARLAVNEFLERNSNFTVGESIRGTPFLTRTY
jgi:O-methyltransferase